MMFIETELAQHRAMLRDILQNQQLIMKALAGHVDTPYYTKQALDNQRDLMRARYGKPSTDQFK